MLHNKLPVKPPPTVGELLRRRLREVKRSPEELAEAVDVPATYIDDLIEGNRRPPLPERTDVYERMTSFLKLGRNDLVASARAQRAARPNGVRAPAAPVRRQLMALCVPRTARTLERRRGRQAGAELAGFMRRLLEVTQGAVRRVLDDPIGLRLAATRAGSSYPDLRLRVLDFLDATPDTLTPEHLAEFVRPRIARWDVDLETGVLRVVLQTQEPKESRRRPATRVPHGRRYGT